MKAIYLCIVTLVLVAMSLKAQVNAPNITLEFKNETLKNVLEKLEEATEYTFSYSSTSIPTSLGITVDLKDASINEALDLIFEETLVVYEIIGKRIILTRNLARQTVRGRVVDRHSQIPILGATVIILNLTPLKGDATDDNGNFRIPNVAAGRYTFKASFLGYQDLLLPGVLVGSGKEVILNIELSESLLQLDEIHVGIAGISSAPVNDMAQISGRSFTVEETKRFPVGVGDPLRLASSFAGVVATDDGDNEIVIRGNSPRGILWKMEGVEIPSPNHFSSEGASTGGISMFSTQVISRSDFLTSAFPAQYGNATAGVFDIQLRNGNNERRESTFQLGLLGIDVSSEGPLNNKRQSSYLFNYRYSTLSLLTNLGLELQGEGEKNVFQDLSFKMNLPTQKAGTFSVFGLGGLSSYTFRLSGIEDTEEYNMGVIGVSNKYIINNSAVLLSTLSLSGTEIVEDYKKPLETVTYEEKTSFKKTFIRGSIELNKKFSVEHFLSSGVTFSFLDYNFQASESDPQRDSLFQRIEWFNDDGNTSSIQAFTSWKYRPIDALTFVSGFHFTHFSFTEESIIEPRFSARWEFSPNSALFGGFGLHSRIESLEYYFGNSPNVDGSSSDLNGDLKLTRSSHFVFGFDTNIGDKVYFKTETYYQHLFNVPILENVPLIARREYIEAASTLNLSDGYVYQSLINGGTGDNYGVEVTVERKFSNNYYFLFNGTLYESTYKGIDGVRRSTRYNGNFGYNLLAGKEFRVGSRKKDKTLGINLKVNHAGNKRYTPVDVALSEANNVELSRLDAAYSSRFANYFRSDLQFSLRKNVKNRTIEWRLDIQNLTNRENIAANYFDFSSGKLEQEGEFGLIPILSYRIEF